MAHNAIAGPLPWMAALFFALLLGMPALGPVFAMGLSRGHAAGVRPQQLFRTLAVACRHRRGGERGGDTHRRWACGVRDTARGTRFPAADHDLGYCRPDFSAGGGAGARRPGDRLRTAPDSRRAVSLRSAADCSERDGRASNRAGNGARGRRRDGPLAPAATVQGRIAARRPGDPGGGARLGHDRDRHRHNRLDGRRADPWDRRSSMGSPRTSCLM